VSPCPAPTPSANAAPTEGSCPAGAGATCGADSSSAGQNEGAGVTGMQRRYLLYDTKYGEGFNLQREVYPRAGWIVHKLNKALKKRCKTREEGKREEGDCARWVLVLPPWCRVVHWWSGPQHLPWSHFFDAGALNGSKVPLIEFEEYRQRVGRAAVDLAVVYAADKLEGEAGKQLTDGKGKFLGWAKELESCAAKYRPIPEHREQDGEKSLIYAGQCEGDIAAKAFKCASLDGPWPQGVVDLMSSLDASVGSVLMKGYDYLLAPDTKELDALGLRESMLFSTEIRERAEHFRAGTLEGRPYLAAHCRRTDFLKARAKSTPSAEAIAGRLNALLSETGLDQVFVATDAPDDLRRDLQREVQGAVHFFDSGAFDHPGKQAAAESWIAARADFFIGTIESRFTMSIELERGFLGKLTATSEQEFCKEFLGKDQKKCVAPAYRHPTRRGAHRDMYL